MDVNSKQYSTTCSGVKSKFCQYNLALTSYRETRLIKNKAIKNILDQSENDKATNISSTRGFHVNSSSSQTRLNSTNLKSNSKSVNFNNTNISVVLSRMEEPTTTNLKTVSLTNITFNTPINRKLLLPKLCKSKLVIDKNKELGVQLDNSNSVMQIQATKSISNYSYDNSLPTHENMKSKHIVDLKKSEPKLKIKGFYSLNGSLVKECIINDESRALSTGYTSSNINNLKAELKGESICLSRKKGEAKNKTLTTTLTSGHFKSKSDFNIYKSIFERPITFKNNNNREFKLSESEYNMIEQANLLTNCEKEENKILITKKKSWLVKGVVDQLYPQIMALRTNLIRKGLIKKK